MYNNSNLVSDFYNRIKQEEMAKEAEEQKKRHELFQVLNTLMERNARQEQMAQQASQFAESLKLQREKFDAEKAHKNAILGLQNQKLNMKSGENNNINSDQYSPAFEKKMDEKEATRLDEELREASKIDIEDILTRIDRVRNALGKVSTGKSFPTRIEKGISQYSGLNKAAEKAYDDIRVFSARNIFENLPQSFKNNFSNTDRQFLERSNFGLDINNETNTDLLNALERGITNTFEKTNFFSDYKKHHGTLHGVEDAWNLLINDERANFMKKRKELKEQGQLQESEKKNIESIKQFNIDDKAPRASSQLDPLADYRSIMHNPLGVPFKDIEDNVKGLTEAAGGFAQGPLDIAYGIAGKKAPQLIPEEDQGLVYTGGNIAGYLHPGKLGMKLASKLGIKNSLIQSLFASGGIEAAKDYEDRLGGGAKGVALGLAGEGIAKVIGKTLEPMIGYGNKVLGTRQKELMKGQKELTKRQKEKELEDLIQEEEKLGSDVYDKVLGKYKVGDNPSKETIEKVQNKYDELEKEFRTRYNELFEETKLSDFRLPVKKLNKVSKKFIRDRGYKLGFNSSKDTTEKKHEDLLNKIKNKLFGESLEESWMGFKGLVETDKEIPKKTKFPIRTKTSKLTLKGMHDLASGLKQQARVNKSQKISGDKKTIASLDLERELLKQDIGKLRNILNEQIPGYKNLTTQFREKVTPYIDNTTSRGIVKGGKEPLNFAKKLNWEENEKLRKLYNVVPKEIKETAATGEFLKGTNIIDKNPKEISQLYRDLMKKGSKNARKTIENQIGKETGKRLEKLPKEMQDITKEIKNITEELVQLKKNDTEKGTYSELINHVTLGTYGKASKLIKELLDKTVDEKKIRLLEKLQNALSQGEGKLLTSTLLSANKPDIEGE